MAWNDLDFIYHFYFGGGENKSLSSIGLLGQVKKRAETVAIGRFRKQILQKAGNHCNSDLVHKFERSYDFKPVVYSLGNATLKGRFKGTVSADGKNGRKVSGLISIRFIDHFTDPLSILEFLYGSSTTTEAPQWLAEAANVGGTRYRLAGTWREQFTDTIPGTER